MLDMYRLMDEWRSFAKNKWMGMVWEVGPLSPQVFYSSDSGLFGVYIINSWYVPSRPSWGPLDSVGNDSSSIISEIKVSFEVLSKYLVSSCVSGVLSAVFRKCFLTNSIWSCKWRILHISQGITCGTGFSGNGGRPFRADLRCSLEEKDCKN